MKKIRVLIVDDSALIRKVLTEIIDSQPDMQAVGAAPDPLVAREMIRNLEPDVLTLDVEMPKMDGLDFLEKLMRLRPMPVVMVSTLTEKGSEIALRSLELGAVDFVAKPKMDIVGGMKEYAYEITDKIRAAAQARIKRPAAFVAATDAAPKRVLPSLGNRGSTEKLIIIGASTGGTEALKDFLVELPADSPAVLVTQHMPPGFTRSFAERLDSLCRMTVSEAVQGERVLPGHAYIAPGALHMAVRKSGANYMVALSDAPVVNRHRPSVEVLFLSAAECVGSNAIGIMLTGMGKDGATAMLEMKRAGSYNFAQDEASCVVFGMPKEAIAVGAVDETVPLRDLARRVFERLALSGVRTNRV
ncbi:MAG: chemotaxis response regulator protein-glutamate methylesterase [Betaproteobacteria bacterium]